MNKHEKQWIYQEAGRYRLFNNIPREFAEHLEMLNANLVGPYEWSSRERHKCQGFIGEVAVIGMR